MLNQPPKAPMIIDSMTRPFIVPVLIAGLAPPSLESPPRSRRRLRPLVQRRHARRPGPRAEREERGRLHQRHAEARQARNDAIQAKRRVRLRVRVVVGPELAKDTVSVDVPSSPLEAVLQALAPRVLVDYEVRQDAQPRPLVIYLLAPADTEPAANVAARGVSQGVVISGHTEETPRPMAAIRSRSPTRTSCRSPPSSGAGARRDGRRRRARRHADMDYPAGELVEVSVVDLPAEDAVLGISPNVAAVRVDLAQAERTPLKLVVTVRTSAAR
jgi:hypothetical protein